MRFWSNFEVEGDTYVRRPWTAATNMFEVRGPMYIFVRRHTWDDGGNFKTRKVGVRGSLHPTTRVTLEDRGI